MTSIWDHSFHLDSPGQSVMKRAGVHNVLYTQCSERITENNLAYFVQLLLVLLEVYFPTQVETDLFQCQTYRNLNH